MLSAGRRARHRWSAVIRRSKSKPNGLMKTTTLSAAASGTFKLGGDLPIHRLGFGAMRITGKGIWGEPEDAEEARRVLRRAVELGQLY